MGNAAKLNTRGPLRKPAKHVLAESKSYIHLFQNPDAQTTLQSGKVMAKAWIKEIEGSQQVIHAQSFLSAILTAYWQEVHGQSLRKKPLPPTRQLPSFVILDNSILAVAVEIGKAAAGFDVITASYQLGNLYTAVLPETVRSTHGVYYTPPALTKRLLTMCSDAGIDWGSSRVVDPACGGGAFLAPVALEMQKALYNKKPDSVIAHIEQHLKGFEIDSFSAWMTQIFVEVALRNNLKSSGRSLASLITITNTLEHPFDASECFDLVIGNPPYGKIKLTDTIKNKFKASLYGHPNMYGLFTHLAIDLLKEGGIIGYLTPTSFVSGEYFKNLRAYLQQNVSVLEIDFVSMRKGVFDDVLQETMLTTYQQKNTGTKAIRRKVTVNEVKVLQDQKTVTHHNGNFLLPIDITTPWILARKPQQTKLVQAMSLMTERLNDWGYRISTGQLVWNRHKDQLTGSYKKGNYPIIWAEAITPDGAFIWRCEKKNHAPWFQFRKGDDFLLTASPCVILQRTTSKEQSKRLIASVLPEDLFSKHHAVIVENHLNMIIQTVKKPKVDLQTLSAFLNSKVVNDAFSTISGSVAVSAYELESLPLPSINTLTHLQKLVKSNQTEQERIEEECLRLYQI